MPRAYDKFPNQRGAGGDSLYSPSRGGLPWQNPLEAITGTAADTVTAIGEFLRTALALDQLEECFTEFAAEFFEIDWLDPAAIRQVIAAAGKLLSGIIQWFWQVIANITRVDLTDESQFVKDLLTLLAFLDLQAGWETFSTGWQALNWGNPLEAIHPAWMLLVDFGWDVAAWVGHIVRNIFGINLPGFLALDELRAHWTGFFTTWNAINWSNPLFGIHDAWMALVDLVWNLLAWAQTVLRNLTGIEIPNFFDFDTLKDLWNGFTSAWAAITWNSLNAIWSAITAVAGFIRGAVHWAIGVFQNLTGIDLEVIAASFGIGALADAITTWADTLAGINWSNPITGLMDAIGAFIALFQGAGNWILGVIEAWLGWNITAVADMFASVQNFVLRVVEFFWGGTGVAAVVDFIDKAAGFVGATFVEAITGAYNEISRLMNLIGSFLNLTALVDFIEGILGEDGLLGFILRIPVIGPLVSTLTGLAPGEAALDFSTLGTWARGLLTGQSPIPGANIVGAIQSAILSVIPVAHISADSPNLLSQGNFNNSLTVSDGGGWSWDSSVTATGTGGSAKLLATGAVQQLFSRQAIKVNAGDRIQVSCRVRTSGFTAGSGRSMVLSIVPWSVVGGVMTQQAAVVVATRTAATESFADMTSASPWTVPAGVVRVTPVLAATASAGAIIWFDDAKVAKSGELGQNLVDSLVTAWNQLFGGLTNPVAGASATTGKTWQDLFSGAAAFRGLFNTEESRGNTLRLNLFGSPNTVGSMLQDNAIPDIGLPKSNAMQQIVNNIFRGLFGDDPGNMTTDDVLTAAQQTANNVATAKSAVAELQAKAAIGSFSGVAQAVDFSTYADGAIPSSVFELNANVWTGSPAGSGQFRVRSGRAAYVTSGLDNRRSVAVHKTPTATAWQRVGVVLATKSSSYQSTTAAVYLGARLNSTGTVGVYAKLNGGSAVQIVDGSGNVLHTGALPAQSAGMHWIEVGVGAAQNRVRVWWESFCLLDHTFGSLPDGGQYTGCGVEARTYSRGGGTYTALPGEIAAFTMYDNKPADTLGSYFLAYRSDTAVAATVATNASLVPNGFFAGPTHRTADLTWDGSTNKLTVSVTGTYMVTVALKRDAFTDTQWSAAAAIFVNGAVHSIGHRQAGVFLNTGGVAVGNRGAVTITVPVYLVAGDYVQPGYASSNASGLTGSAFPESYMSVAFMNNTKPVQPVAA